MSLRDGCVREASIDLLKETVSVLRVLRGHKGPITAIGLFGGTIYGGAGSECQVISGSEDGFVRIWRSATREEMYSGEFEEPSPRSNKGKPYNNNNNYNNRAMAIIIIIIIIIIMGSATGGGPGGPWPPKEWNGGANNAFCPPPNFLGK